MNRSKNQTLNVTLLEPKLKHPTIFAIFDELNPSESFTILNDHDPKPLYYQMLGERGNIFEWEYLENGPDIWQVRITRSMQYTPEDTIGGMASKDARKIKVFQKFGLDFCCGGNKSLKDACSIAGVDPELVEHDLNKLKDDAPDKHYDYDSWNLSFLSDHIYNIHHNYTRTILSEIEQYTRKVVSVHSKDHPYLKKLEHVVETLSSELELHMLKEENILFPFIKRLEQHDASESAFAQHFSSINEPIRVMQVEHESAGDLFLGIREITQNYRLPEHACASFIHLYDILKELDDDLHLHIHLENNILFPKALTLAKTL